MYNLYSGNGENWYEEFEILDCFWDMEKDSDKEFFKWLNSTKFHTFLEFVEFIDNHWSFDTGTLYDVLYEWFYVDELQCEKCLHEEFKKYVAEHYQQYGIQMTTEYEENEQMALF